MQESSNGSSTFPSWQEILTKIEELVDSESIIEGSPWVSNSRINELFHQKYEFSPEDVAKANGFDFKNAIARSKRFSIYNTLNPHEFYIAIFNSILPEFLQERPTNKKNKYQIKRSWKVDRSLIKMLRSEGYEKISHEHTDSTSEIKSRDQQRRQYEYEIKSISDIKSVNDLEFYLTQIVSILTNSNPMKFVTISEISQSF
jgi:hypothetical protein